MKRFTTLFMMMLLCATMFAQDPNFHIYLAFGQSNMEGNATPEAQDKSNIPSRFKMMAAVNFNNPSRTKGKWYPAAPPLCREGTGLTPCDYFGRTLCEKLPENITIGVINVAVGGTKIEGFMQDKVESYIASMNPSSESWLINYFKAYDNDPYKRLIDMAKIAQRDGVIKGILLHQGCSNNMQSDWPQKVKTIYERMLNDLALSPDEVPLLVGELVGQDEGGSCYGHNAACIAKMPDLIKHCYVISSKGCPQRGDGLHFTAEGYREMGRRYAAAMLDFLEKCDENAQFDAVSIEPSASEMVMTPGLSSIFAIYATDADGKQYNVTRKCTFTSDNPDVADVDGIKMIAKGFSGETTVHVTFQDQSGNTVTSDIKVSIELFPFTASGFNPSISGSGSFTEKTHSLKTSKDGFGGWQYADGIDISEYKYLVVRLRLASSAKPTVRLYNTTDANGDYYEYEMQRTKEAVIELAGLKTIGGKNLNLKKIRMIGFSSNGSAAMYVTEVFLSNDGETPATGIINLQNDAPSYGIYDLMGRKTDSPAKGIYIIDGKKVLVK